MSHAIQVHPLSAVNIENKVNQFIKNNDIEYPFNVHSFLEFCLEDKLGYSLNILPNRNGVNIDGVVEFVSKSLSLTEGSYMGLLSGNYRNRFTGAHELGHIVLHSEQIKERIVSEKITNGKNMYRKSKDIPSYRDAEWQANYFAAALIMPANHMVLKMKKRQTLRQISEYFGASQESVRIRIKAVIKLVKGRKINNNVNQETLRHYIDIINQPF